MQKCFSLIHDIACSGIFFNVEAHAHQHLGRVPLSHTFDPVVCERALTSHWPAFITYSSPRPHSFCYPSNTTSASASFFGLLRLRFLLLLGLL
eukprot:20138_4